MDLMGIHGGWGRTNLNSAKRRGGGGVLRGGSYKTIWERSRMRKDNKRVNNLGKMGTGGPLCSKKGKNVFTRETWIRAHFC